MANLSSSESIYVLRGVQAFKSKTSSGCKELSVEELQDAKLYWYRQIQWCTKQSMRRVKENILLPNTSAILKLDPFYDKRDRLLGVGGRLQYSDLPEGTNIQLSYHMAIQWLQRSYRVYMRSCFKGQAEGRRVLGKRLVCQRQRVGPCSQKMAPLPSERVLSSPAITHVGIDFAGPLFVRGGPTSTKAYVYMFTCASSHMTRLELIITSDLSTNEFFQALIRMISRRGLSSTIWFVNAKTFKSADCEIQQLFTQGLSADRQLWNKIDQEESQAKFSFREIKWTFIVERSPWGGG